MKKHPKKEKEKDPKKQTRPLLLSANLYKMLIIYIIVYTITVCIRFYFYSTLYMCWKGMGNKQNNNNNYIDISVYIIRGAGSARFVINWYTLPDGGTNRVNYPNGSPIADFLLRQVNVDLR